MNKLPRFKLRPLVFLIVGLASISSSGQEAQLLRLVQTIPMPNVKGRIDHMDVDVKGKRLFIAGLENGSLEIVDLKTGKWAKSIPGFQKPQGIAYVGPLKKVFVASGDDGMLRVFQADRMELLDSISLESGPNRLTYDPRKKLVYIGYDGKDGGQDYGEIGIVDAKADKHLADIRIGGHPAELLLDESGNTLFVFLSRVSKVQVIDTQKREVEATWPVSSQRNGDGALDEGSQRLLIGTRTPPQMVAMESRTGKEVVNLPTVEGMDGVYFDSTRKRVYVSGGRDKDVGSIFVYQQKDADHYELLGKIPTRPGAGTSFWSPELNRYFVAAPAHEREEAAILVFEPVS
jgi:DNA-binding beta-propeller fold protein YncE